MQQSALHTPAHPSLAPPCLPAPAAACRPLLPPLRLRLLLQSAALLPWLSETQQTPGWHHQLTRTLHRRTASTAACMQLVRLPATLKCNAHKLPQRKSPKSHPARLRFMHYCLCSLSNIQCSARMQAICKPAQPRCYRASAALHAH